MSITLFIEGKKDGEGELRRGFSKLLEKKLAGCMPKIVMGTNTNETLKKHFSRPDSCALIDLDRPPEDREQRCIELGIHHNSSIHFMIQKMEAWFLSQPEVLESYYHTKLKVPGCPPKSIVNPDELLRDITAKSQAGKYHKVQHGAELLTLLDPDRLSRDFPDFSSLLNALRQS